MNIPNIDTWIHGDHDTMPDCELTRKQREAIERERRDQIRRDIETENNVDSQRTDSEDAQR